MTCSYSKPSYRICNLLNNSYKNDSDIASKIKTVIEHINNDFTDAFGKCPYLWMDVKMSSFKSKSSIQQDIK